MCKLTISFYGEPIDTIVRKTKRECTAVARAHYKGVAYVWKWS